MLLSHLFFGWVSDNHVQGSLLISRDNDNRTPLDLARIHNNWPAYLILRLNDNHAFNDELKSIVTYFLDVFEKMKVTDLNSIKLHMIHFSATNNIEGMVNLLDMFDDTEETWFPVSFNCSSDPNHFIFEINVGKSRIRHRTTLELNDEFQDRLKIQTSNSESFFVG